MPGPASEPNPKAPLDPKIPTKEPSETKDPVDAKQSESLVSTPLMDASTVAGARPLEEITPDATAPYVPTPASEAPNIPGYRITGELAKGGMGRVFAAYDLSLGREVAIKTLLPGADAERFVTEAKITARLPHPNIPPVHALGVLEDGTPWLAMKFIHGQTLDRLLKDRRTPRQDLPHYIQIFEQIAQAVGFAHSRGVIHRDLKPLNVMVGQFGEVLVMDWGLAKEMSPNQASEGRGSFASAPPEESRLTLAGTVMGTPGYMAPEQARGEDVDARADVFALGSILAQILTGQPAFVGKTVAETLRKAASAELDDVVARLDASEADKELVFLAKRCLAANREDRLTNGHAVASEVAAYRAGVEVRLRQAEMDRARAETRAAEQLKRRRMALWAGGLIVAVLSVGLVVSLWQMQRAIRAEIQARTNEQLAVRNAIAAQVERDAKVKALATERATRRKAIAALRMLTDEVVERQLARAKTLSDENKAFLRKIIEQFEDLAAIAGEEVEGQFIRSEGFARVGVMRHVLGELGAAEEAYRAALELQRQLLAKIPTQREFRHATAKTYNNLALVLTATGRFQEAEQAYRAALSLRQDLLAEFPAEPDFRRDLAKLYLNLGGLLHATGRHQDSEKALRAALGLFQDLFNEYPAETDLRQDLISIHNELGGLLSDIGRYKEAEAAYQAARTILGELPSDQLSQPEFRLALAETYTRSGKLLRMLGQPEEAEEAYRAACGLFQQLANDFPRISDFRNGLAESLNGLGSLLQNTGRVREAEEAYRQALKLRQQLAAEHPDAITVRQTLASSHDNLGVLLASMGRFKEAKEEYQVGCKLREELVSEFPARPEFRQGLAGSYLNLGNLLGATGQFDEAERAYRVALKLRQELVADFPERPDFQQDLAVSQTNLAILLAQRGRLQEAEGALRAAHELRLRLVQDFPERRDFRQDLAGSYNNLAIWLKNTGQSQKAEEAFLAAQDLYEKLLAELPNQSELQTHFAASCVNLANLCLGRGDFPAVKRHLEKGEPHLFAVIRANPQNPLSWQIQRNYLRLLIAVQAWQLEPEQALRTAHARRDLGWDPPIDAYDAASFLCSCVTIIEKHEKLTDDEKRRAAQFYMEEAINLLRESIAKGFKDHEELEKNEAFAPLRNREDFKRLLAEMGGEPIYRK